MTEVWQSTVQKIFLVQTAIAETQMIPLATLPVIRMGSKRATMGTLILLQIAPSAYQQMDVVSTSGSYISFYTKPGC